ncbi:oxidoreductase-like domain-containing protein [Neptunomonas qingdaonensis]|uniref:Oxidoreductase-like protein, N-terminal n=1 Tax=Neptunomonas qingdaonensis TaxID=1045558 RepID=A0A1I2LM95_9GAMM|nr:oxidoreductase-like domain-containing protein [Neptunomonas qingdaonensis]SFF80385.1 Oxidoreductase-like protein, N-terminal [Neptunomonas qingdaonensis]
MLEKPTPPGDCECCEAGCEPCVWDIYYEDMREWKAAQEKLKAAQEVESADGKTTENADEKQAESRV